MSTALPPVPLPLTPDDVPAQVAADEARRLLEARQPAGEERTLEVGGVRFPLRTAGQGRPVLLVHGLGHDMSDWRPLFERRPAGLRLAALDLPGFGLAGKPPRSYTLDLLVDAVLAAARAVGGAPLIVGSSLGGHVALLAALRDPGASSGLFLIAPGGLEPAPLTTQLVARAYYSFGALCARPDSDIVKNSRRLFVRQSPASEALAARKLAVHRSPLRASFARPFADVVADVFRHPVGERCGSLRPPVHLLFGEQDVIVPPASGRRAEQRHGFGLTRLEGVGHLPMVEAPDAFVAELQRFSQRAFKEAPDVPR